MSDARDLIKYPFPNGEYVPWDFNTHKNDEYINSPNETTINRLGVEVPTWTGICNKAKLDTEAAVASATAQAESYRDQAETARDDAIAAASASGDFIFVKDLADMQSKLPLPDGTIIEVAVDANHDDSRTRYVVGSGVPVFAVNLDSLRQQLGNVDNPEDGAEIVAFVQSYEGSVVRSVMDKGRETYSALDAGASPFASAAANTIALNLAAAVCTDNNLELLIPPGNYQINGTVLLGNCHVKAYGATFFPDSSVQTAVQFGTDSLVFSKTARGIAVRGVGMSLHPSDSSAILYYNCSNALFEVNEGNRMTYGALVKPGTGCRVAYCTWISPYFHRNVENWRVDLRSGAGFAAENTVIGGRLQLSSTEESTYHVNTNRESGAGSMNHWRWYGVSMEGRSTGSTPSNCRAAMRLFAADYWDMKSIRTEGEWLDADFVLAANTTGNRIELTYNDGSINVQDLGVNNIVQYQRIQSSNSTTGSGYQPAASVVQTFYRDSTARIEVLSSETTGASVRLGNKANPEGAEFLYSPASSSAIFRVSGSNRFEITSSSVQPWQNNVMTCGSPARLWTQVYASTGTINTSDARLKTNVRQLSKAEVKAARLLANEIGSFQWLSSIEEKGKDLARQHIGMTVQRAIEIMESEGLSPLDYAFICYDEWDDEYERIEEKLEFKTDEHGKILIDVDGNHIISVNVPAHDVLVQKAGNRYSFRLDQLYAFIIRGLSQAHDDLDDRLSALESKS